MLPAHTGFLGCSAAWRKEKKPRQRDIMVWGTQRSRWPRLRGVVSQRRQQRRDFGGSCAELGPARGNIRNPCAARSSSACDSAVGLLERHTERLCHLQPFQLQLPAGAAGQKQSGDAPLQTGL